MKSMLDPIEALNRILSSRCGPKVKTALLATMEGLSYRQACQFAGLPLERATDIHKAATRMDLRDFHNERRNQRRALLEYRARMKFLLHVRNRKGSPNELLRATKWIDQFEEKFG